MTEITPSLLEKKLIFKRFKLLKLICFSHFSWVYVGKNIIENVPVAIKIEKSTNYNLLESEAYILTSVKGFGIPEVISFGKYGPFKILIEEFLGKDVLTLWKLGPFKDDPFGQKNKYIKDICLFAIQGLERLKYIHDKNIIHRDIKTDNFLIGRKDPDIIYLIDFGFAKKYRSSRTGKHIKFSKTGNLIGSMNYASCNSMKGYEISRRDDLESFGYLLLNLAKGGLAPWIKYCEMKNISLYNKLQTILKIKMNITEENAYKGLPNEFLDYMKYVKKLEFEQEPDYKYLINLFISILSKNEIKRNTTFFWIIQKSNKEKKIFEEKENNKSNDTLKHIRINSFKERKSPFKTLYHKIKESLINKNKLNNYYNINNTIKNGEKKEILIHKRNKINISDIHNYYYLNNNTTNTEKDLPKTKIDKAMMERPTIFNTAGEKKKKKYINLNNKNKTPKSQKINNNKKNGVLIKSGNLTDRYIKNIKLYNNINYNNIIFIEKNSNSKINIRNNSISNKPIFEINNSLDNRINDLNLKKNILYNPMFNFNSKEQLNNNTKSLSKRLCIHENINSNVF